MKRILKKTILRSSLICCVILRRDFPKFSEAFRAYGAPRLGESQLFDLELSLEELIVNSFSHGNSGGPVLVHVCMDGKDARVTIEDSAPPFNLLRESPEPPQGPPAQRKAGGLGIHLVKNLTDRLEYFGSKKGNQIVLFKSRH